MSKKFSISVGYEKMELELIGENTLSVNGVGHTFDFQQIGTDTYSLILDGKSYQVFHQRTAEFKNGGDNHEGAMTLEVNGTEYAVVVDDERSLLRKAFLKDHPVSGGKETIHAPMPGMIARIETREGDEVDAGDPLLVLEAMKMENELKAKQRGRVERIHVKPGMTVEKGELLITLLAI